MRKPQGHLTFFSLEITSFFLYATKLPPFTSVNHIRIVLFWTCFSWDILSSLNLCISTSFFFFLIFGNLKTHLKYLSYILPSLFFQGLWYDLFSLPISSRNFSNVFLFHFILLIFSDLLSTSLSEFLATYSFLFLVIRVSFP